MIEKPTSLTGTFVHTPPVKAPSINSGLSSKPKLSTHGKHQNRRLKAFYQNRNALIGASFLVIVALAAILAPILAPFDPTATDMTNIYGPINGQHLLGTDELGRDVLSRLLFATRLSMAVSVISVFTALIFSFPLGLAAGYFGGKVDAIVVFLIDIILSVPPLILVFAIAGVLGSSIRNAMIALAVYFTPLFARLIRIETRRIRHSQLGEASRAIGIPAPLIMIRHVIPNILPSLVVQVSLMLGVALLAEAALSFLGLGVRPPDASWGVMLRSAFENMLINPSSMFPPAIAITATVMAWNSLTDGIRDAFGRLDN